VSNKYIIPTIKKKFNRFYIPRQQKLHDLVIWFALTFGAFLPVRWFFYGQVTHNVIPNLGIVTLIAIIIFLLVRSGKIGFVGRAFNRQMIRFVASRQFKRVLVFSLALSLYTGIPIYFIERGEFEYQDELQLFDANSIRSSYIRNIVMNTTEPIFDNGKTGDDMHKQFMSNTDFCNTQPNECIVNYDKLKYEDYERIVLVKILPPREVFDAVNNMTLMESFDYNVKMANNYDFLLSSAMYFANVESQGWTGHFSTVWFVEQIEAIGLFFLYRKLYMKKTDSLKWLGIFDNNLKRIMYKTKKHDKFYKGTNTNPSDKNIIKISISMVIIGLLFMVVRFMFDEPIFGGVGIAIIGVSIAYIVRKERKRKLKLK
jgi:hypothetical protein